MADSKHKFAHIVITGASSGLGEALALYHAGPNVRLCLSGRDAVRLDGVAQACRKKGADVAVKIIDVTDRAGMKAWLEAADDSCPIDLVIANAGISAGMGESDAGESPEQVRRLFEVNVGGVLNTIDPLLPRMIARRKGHIGLMSSLAGFRGWPGAPAYCATKAAVRIYGEGLRGVLLKHGVKVSVICPGFVKSRMTKVNEFPMPLIMSAEKAAKIIARGLERGRGRVAFPLTIFLFVWFCAVLPDRIAGLLLKGTPQKKSVKSLI